jgi:hypothetical protein
MSKSTQPFFLSVMLLILFAVNLILTGQSFAQDEIILGEIQHHVRNDEIIWDWFYSTDNNFSRFQSLRWTNPIV